eukprot:g3056.t1
MVLLLKTMEMMAVVMVLVLAMMTSMHASAEETLFSHPHFPKRFTASVIATSHLVDADAEYPSAVRELSVVYDAVKGRVWANVTKGYQQGRLFIRRYDVDEEYAIRHGEFEGCKRAFLAQKMPAPQFPRAATFAGKAPCPSKRSMLCERWEISLQGERSDIFVDAATAVPVSLTHHQQDTEGVLIPAMTYELRNLRLMHEIHDAQFELPEPYVHDACERHQGGFPYIHAFHHYLRF